MAPRWATPRTPERATFGPAVGKIAALLGRPLMPWQQQVVDVALEVQSEAAGDPAPGEWAYDDVTITVQRQAGKTTLLQPVIAHRCGSRVGAKVFGTAQKRDKARARFLDTTSAFLTSKLAPQVHRKTGVSHEELRWVETQSTFVPFAPNEDDMHGETPDLVLVDELWAFEQAAAQALQAAYVPGFLTKDAQAWKTSTAGTERSWWLNTARAAGRRSVEAGGRLGTAYFEWSLPDEVDGVPLRELSDDELVQACIDHHPATGHTLRPAAVWSAWRQMAGDRAAFLRAYGNRTAADATGLWRAVTESAYVGGLTTDEIPADAMVGLGVWVDERGEDAAVVAGWRSPSGRMLVELIRHDVGTAWVAPYVAGVRGRQDVTAVAVANVGTARNVADQLEAGEVEGLLRVAQADLPAATARHLEELALPEGSRWGHRASEAGEAAAKAAVLLRSRAYGRDEAPMSAWGAQALAGWAVDHAPKVVDLGEFRIR